MKSLWALLAVGVMGCSSSSASPADETGDDAGKSVAHTGDDDAAQAAGDDDAATTVTSDSGTLGGWHPGAGDAGDAGDAGTSASTMSASVGPIPLQSNEETTVCITMRLPNETAVYVPRIQVDLAPGSHHLVTYRSNATTESLTPTPCTAFQGVLDGNAVPLMISEKPSDDLTFPQGVALKIQPHQMVMLEAHYINTGTQTIQGHGSVSFTTIPVTTANVIESDLGFYGTMSIFLGSGVQSINPIFVKGLAGTHGFALTTHQHRLGKEFKVWSSKSAGDTSGTPIADTTDWANPPLYRLSPELDFDGTNGLSYQCTWNNTTGQIVTFGESALQEMCFLWMYYYPTHGFDMRFQ